MSDRRLNLVFLVVTVFGIGAIAACDGGSATPAPGVAGARLSASAAIEHMKLRYAKVNSYRDHGHCTVISKATRGSADPGLCIDFTTAFDRSKGLCWRVEQRFGTQPDVNIVLVRTRDFLSFDWSWSEAGLGGRGVGAWAAFKDSLGNTGHMAGIVPAWLVPTVDLRSVRLELSSLSRVADAGDEAIGGVQCRMIDAIGWQDQQLRFWIDGAGALRRLRAVREMPAAFDIPASSIETRIDYAPEFEVPIPAEALDSSERQPPTPVAPEG